MGHGPGLNLSRKICKQLKEQAGGGKGKKKKKKREERGKKSPKQLAVAIRSHLCQDLRNFLFEKGILSPLLSPQEENGHGASHMD